MLVQGKRIRRYRQRKNLETDSKEYVFCLHVGCLKYLGNIQVEEFNMARMVG